MVKHLLPHSRHNDMERNAYNAAFHELGFRWHWDNQTYEQLTRKSSNAADQILHYLTDHQPHLLKAYHPEFLVNAIQQKKGLFEARNAGQVAPAVGHFDWAQTLGCEIGA